MCRPSSGVPGFDFLAEFLFTVVVYSKQRALSGWEEPCGRCGSQPVILGENVFPTSVQRLSAGFGLGLLLSPSSLTLSFCWPDCAVHMCLLGILGAWDGAFIYFASSQAPACGLVLI